MIMIILNHTNNHDQDMIKMNVNSVKIIDVYNTNWYLPLVGHNPYIRTVQLQNHSY